MRWSWVVCGVLALCACDGEPAPRDSADLLVLELGGDNQPLSRALSRLRQASAPPTVAVPIEAPAAAVQPPAAGEPPAGGEPPADEPPPPPEPEFFTVRLRGGETLYGLARSHLRSASRWREILVLNGWSEAQASALPVGAAVKIPIR